MGVYTTVVVPHIPTDMAAEPFRCWRHGREHFTLNLIRPTIRLHLSLFRGHQSATRWSSVIVVILLIRFPLLVLVVVSGCLYRAAHRPVEAGGVSLTLGGGAETTHASLFAFYAPVVDTGPA